MCIAPFPIKPVTILFVTPLPLRRIIHLTNIAPSTTASSSTPPTLEQHTGQSFFTSGEPFVKLVSLISPHYGHQTTTPHPQSLAPLAAVVSSIKPIESGKSRLDLVVVNVIRAATSPRIPWGHTLHVMPLPARGPKTCTCR
jgi:hypothetical protein